MRRARIYALPNPRARLLRRHRATLVGALCGAAGVAAGLLLRHLLDDFWDIPDRRAERENDEGIALDL